MASLIQDLVNKLEKTNVRNDTPEGVSFAKRSLKLDSEKDVEEIVKAIKECPCMEYLDLEGNTLGPIAAMTIAETLKTNGADLKRALWKDMFTGRLKDEIPKALEYLGNGLSIAHTRLIELDLSDNALGPIGVQGLAKFLTSSTCYTLQQLRLNNNGLGITGGKMLAQALLDCYKDSCKQGTQPLALKVFIAGRNRLENEGATALASVFQKLGSLEEVVMPQNGIYHPGISALANSLSFNKKLSVLNLNDNTVGPKGAQSLAQALPNFPCLRILNLGDCLIKTKGALILTEALGVAENHPKLMELNLSFNEIRAGATDHIAKAMADKNNLEILQLDGNLFGTKGLNNLREHLSKVNRIDALCPFDENESDSELEESDDDESDANQSDNGSEENKESESEDISQNPIEESKIKELTSEFSVENFLKKPSGDKLLTLREIQVQEVVDFTWKIVKDKGNSLNNRFIEEFVKIIMKISSICGSGYSDIRMKAENLTESLYKELFKYAVENKQISDLHNALLINLGLMKGEDKLTNKIDWDLEGCFQALKKICRNDYFLTETKITLKVFLEQKGKYPLKINDQFQESKESLQEVLNCMQVT